MRDGLSTGRSGNFCGPRRRTGTTCAVDPEDGVEDRRARRLSARHAWCHMKKVLIPLAIIVAALVGRSFRPSPRPEMVSGPGHRALAPNATRSSEHKRAASGTIYMGALGISRESQMGAPGGFDAVRPANSAWRAIGDAEEAPRHDTPVLRSPAFADLRRLCAEALGHAARNPLDAGDGPAPSLWSAKGET